MAAVKNKDIPEEFEFTGKYFEFRKKFWAPEPSDEYWSSMIEASDSLSRAYHSDYLNGLILTCVDDIDKRAKSAFGSSWHGGDVVDSVYRRLKHDSTRTV